MLVSERVVEGVKHLFIAQLRLELSENSIDILDTELGKVVTKFSILLLLVCFDLSKVQNIVVSGICLS